MFLLIHSHRPRAAAVRGVTKLARACALTATLWAGGAAQAQLSEGTALTLLAGGVPFSTVVVSDSQTEYVDGPVSRQTVLDISSMGSFQVIRSTQPGSAFQANAGLAFDMELPSHLNWASFISTGTTFAATTPWQINISASNPRLVSLSHPGLALGSFSSTGPETATAYFEYTVSNVSAVPEPSAALLAGAGLLVLGLRRRALHGR